MKITQEQLTLMLNNHALWLEDNTKGERFNGRDLDLSNTDLANVNLANAYLYNANLSDTDLANADLSGANLANAYLSRTNLSDAYLFDANLYNANLYNANLSRTNLSDAYLSDANLSNANLSNANLYRADLLKIKNKFIFTFQIGKHFAYYCDGFIKIGCKCLTIDEWIERGREIGLGNNYSEEEIKNYIKAIEFIKGNFL